MKSQASKMVCKKEKKWVSVCFAGVFSIAFWNTILFPTFLEDKNPVISRGSLGGYYTVLHIAARYGQENILMWYREQLNYPDLNPLGGLHLC